MVLNAVSEECIDFFLFYVRLAPIVVLSLFSRLLVFPYKIVGERDRELD